MRDDIGAILCGAPPGDIDNRLTSAQMRRAGQVAIQPGRLYLCPAARPAPVDIDNPDRRG